MSSWPGLGLAQRARPAIAAILGWPDGTVAECERLEQEHAGWKIWYHEGTECWVATRPRPWQLDEKAWASTAAALSESLGEIGAST